MRIATILVATIAAATLPTAHAAFKCVDEKGRTHVGETPPPACDNAVMYETNRAGTVIRKIEPTRGGTEKADDAAAKAAEAKKVSEQKRRDAVLLDTYASEKEIDAARDRNLELLNGRLATARDLHKRAQARMKELEPLAKRSPAQYGPDFERVKSEESMHGASVAKLEQELAATKEKFAADKARWVELRKK